MTKTKTKPLAGEEVQRHFEEQYGMYRIVTGRRRGSWEAIAYTGTRKVAENLDDSLDRVVNSVKATLDRRSAKFKSQRVQGVPAQQEYEDALSTISGNLSEQVVQILTIHSRMPNRSISLLDLSNLVRSSNDLVVAEYARLGRRLSVALDFIPTYKKFVRTLTPIMVIAISDNDDENSNAVWTLRPEFVGALQEMKFISD